MRRSRISVKPNVRPGGRAVAPTTENKTSQEPGAVDNTQTHTEEQINNPSSSLQSHLDVIEPAVATGDGNVPDRPSEKASVTTGDRVPSSASITAATVHQRRSRISATPNLARPKVRSAAPASIVKAASLPSVPSKSSPDSPVPAATSRDDSLNSTLSDSNHEKTTATTNSRPSSARLLSSSVCHEPSVQKTPPTPTRPQQEPCHTPKKSSSAPQEAVNPCSSKLSPCIKLSRCDGLGSPLKNSEPTSDKQRVLRALKLKELMKLEKKKEFTKKRKSRREMPEYSDEVDLSKMTLADFIYYIPEANPMKSSLSTEQASAVTVVPPSPMAPPKLAEPEPEEDEEEDTELMVPKVRVAEDGSLILDEESLTVRVQRTSDTVVDDATPLFERGSTTTYMSFRKYNHVKCWSVRETDMFYLAISMVGTDFSMMAQLLTHRTRTEIKSKFKKEEKINAWRVDKAFQNKRPFDREFFSFLLKRVLEKDKMKGKAIKLVVKPNKANKRKGGKKGKKHEDEDIIGDDDEMDDTFEKSKRKREPKESTGKKTCKRRKSNKSNKAEEHEHTPQVEDDSVNAENEDPSLMSKPKEKQKCLRKLKKKRCEEELEDEQKSKRNKKTVPDEEPVDNDGMEENGIGHMPSKTCKERNPKGKQKTKKNKKLSEEGTEDELNSVSGEVSTAEPVAEEDMGEKLTAETAAEEEIPENTSKRCIKPLPKIPQRKAKKSFFVSNVPVQDEDTTDDKDASCREAECEFQDDSLTQSQLQKQAVVVLERTPPRLLKTHGWYVSPDQSQTAQILQDSPGRQRRAENVKRNLSGSERERNETGKINECQTASGSDTTEGDMTVNALSCQEDTQEYREMEADKHMVEDFSIQHHLLVSTDVYDQIILKTPVVMVSREEVHRYPTLTKTAEGMASSFESLLDDTSAEFNSGEEQMDRPVEKSSSGVTLKDKVSQNPEMKESTSSSSQQCMRSTEEHPTYSETLKEKVIEDLIVNESVRGDIQTTIDDDFSFSSDEEAPTVNKTVVREILSFLDKPNLPFTSSDEEPLEMVVRKTWENKEQMSDMEECDSHFETTTLETQEELTVPISWFEQSEGSQQNSRHHEDLIEENADVRRCHSPAEANYCALDLSMNISSEDTFVSCEANLQECKQAKGPLSSGQLLGQKQTIGPTAPLNDNFIINTEESKPVITDIFVSPPGTCCRVLTKTPSASFSEAPSNTCDMNTMLFCETTSEDVQKLVSSSKEKVNKMEKSNSGMEDQAENLSKTAEDFSAHLKGNAKSDILDLAGVETDKKPEEPTFILTLYEIPTSQLFHETSVGHQENHSFDLHPAEVQTPHQFSSDSQSHPSISDDSSALLNKRSEETGKPCENVSETFVFKDAVKDANTQLITSEKHNLDDGKNQETVFNKDYMPADETSLLKLEEMKSERKAPQRRSKIKVKPNLRPFVKVGSTKTECASTQKTTGIIHLQHTETNQKTPVQETVMTYVPHIHSNPEDTKEQIHNGGPSTGSKPLSEDIMLGSPLNTDLQMGMDTAVDLSMRKFSNVPDLQSTGIKMFDEVEDKDCGSVPCVVMVDAPVTASGADKHSTRLLSTKTVAGVSKALEFDTFQESLNLASTSQDKTDPFKCMMYVRPEINQETTCTKDDSSKQEYLNFGFKRPAIAAITLKDQIKEESLKVKEKADQEEFSNDSKEDLDLDLVPTCAETQSVEKTEDDPGVVSHMVLSDMFVAVSEENKDDVLMDSESSFHLHHASAVEKDENLTTAVDQEVREHEEVSNMIPVSEEEQEGLGIERIYVGERSPDKSKSSQVKEHVSCAGLTKMGSSSSPKMRRSPKKGGMLKVKMMFPKRSRKECSTTSPTEHLSNSNTKEIEGSTKYPQQCVVEAIPCANSPSTDSLDNQGECEGVSHVVLSDIFVPVSDGNEESSLHKEALMVGKLCDETLTASQSSEQNIPSCRRVVKQTAGSLEPQSGEEWSLRSNLLPMDSNEIENWCEGVSHMLLSDAFVPVSKEQNIPDPKEFVASGSVKDTENAKECGRKSEKSNKEYQSDCTSGTLKPFKKTKERLTDSQSKTSPRRQSTLQMTLRSPGRSATNEPSTTQAVATTSQRAKTSKEKKESIHTPTRPQVEVFRDCRIPLERLTLEEICQHDLQPIHHSTPLNVKFFPKGNESRNMGFPSHAVQEQTMPSRDWPKVVLNRITINTTDADSSTSTSSPVRTSTAAYQPLDDYQGSPHNSALNADDEPASVSQFFLDNIFTEVDLD